jgi:hypothetical protein
MADNHDRIPIKPGPTGHDCAVVPKPPVSEKLHPIGKYTGDVVEGVRALGVPSHLDLFQGCEILKNLFFQDFEFPSQDPNLVRDVDALVLGGLQEPVDLVLEIDDVPLELQM